MKEKNTSCVTRPYGRPHIAIIKADHSEPDIWEHSALKGRYYSRLTKYQEVRPFWSSNYSLSKHRQQKPYISPAAAAAAAAAVATSISVQPVKQGRALCGNERRRASNCWEIVQIFMFALCVKLKWVYRQIIFYYCFTSVSLCPHHQAPVPFFFFFWSR